MLGTPIQHQFHKALSSLLDEGQAGALNLMDMAMAMAGRGEISETTGKEIEQLAELANIRRGIRASIREEQESS